MNQATGDDRPEEGNLLDPDEEIEEKLDWEENLEREYGGLSEDKEERRSKVMGPGFSKQKQVMEENKFYQGTGQKRTIHLKK